MGEGWEVREWLISTGDCKYNGQPEGVPEERLTIQ